MAIRYKKNGEVHLTDTVADTLSRVNNDPNRAYLELASFVGTYLIYKTNGNPRVPRELGKLITHPQFYKTPVAEKRTQHEALLAHCHAIARHGKGNGNPAPAPAPEPEPVPDIPEPTPEPTPEPEPEPTGIKGTIANFRKRVAELRAFGKSRGFDAMDSMRPMIDGVKLIAAGAPMAAVIDSITATWQEDSKVQAGVSPFNFSEWGRKNGSPDNAHGVAAYVALCVKANVPVWLHGPAGTGKSSGAKYAAEAAGLDYYEVNLAGAMASAVKGKDRLKEFIESAFTKAYEFGGVCALEEFDAAHPTVATAVNNAIAGDEFWNDADGRCIKRHKNFRLIVTANTLGTGGTTKFTGRNKLDGATLDRFRAGTIYCGLDTMLEDSIIDSMVDAL